MTGAEVFAEGLDHPEGVAYEPESLVIDGQPAIPANTDGGLVIEFPSKSDRPDLDLTLIPEGANVFGRRTITRSEFRLRVEEDFDLSRRLDRQLRAIVLITEMGRDQVLQSGAIQQG